MNVSIASSLPSPKPRLWLIVCYSHLHLVPHLFVTSQCIYSLAFVITPVFPPFGAAHFASVPVWFLICCSSRSERFFLLSVKINVQWTGKYRLNIWMFWVEKKPCKEFICGFVFVLFFNKCQTELFFIVHIPCCKQWKMMQNVTCYFSHIYNIGYIHCLNWVHQFSCSLLQVTNQPIK